jgi:3-deoxy-D-manno-octulosonate 8-phosphate phosphatase (KDO 8-P phosphatase)
MDDKLAERIRPLKLLILDVDGVLTDGRIIMDDAGRETKNFHVRDGHGIKLLIRYGIDVLFITGRTSPVVEHRARELGVTEIHQGIRNKAAVMEVILEERGISRGQVACVGDDVVDVPLLRRAGFAAAVADAPEYVKAAAHYVTEKRGGCGAVREVCDLILRVQGKWPEVAGRYELT